MTTPDEGLPDSGSPSSPSGPPPAPTGSPGPPPAYPVPPPPPYGAPPGVAPPPGWGPPPGGPAYGSAYPGYGQGPSSAPPGWWVPQSAPTDGMAVASLVLSIVGLFLWFVGPLLGLILGLVARGRTRPGMRRGRGLANAGIIVGGIFLVLQVLFVVLVVTNAAQVRVTHHDHGPGQVQTDAPGGSGSVVATASSA